MSTTYTATVDLDQIGFDEKQAGSLLEKLKTYHPVVSQSPTGRLSATISYPAENLRQAIDTAISVVTTAANLAAIGVEVLTTAEWDKREGFTTIPELISTSEFAELLGISRPRVGQMIDEGKLTTATKVGGTTVIAMSEAIAKARAAGRDTSKYEPGLD